LPTATGKIRCALFGYNLRVRLSDFIVKRTTPAPP